MKVIGFKRDVIELGPNKEGLPYLEDDSEGDSPTSTEAGPEEKPEEPQEQETFSEVNTEEEKSEEEVHYRVPANIQELTQETPSQSKQKKDLEIVSKSKSVPFRKVLADLMETEILSNLEANCSGPERAEVGQAVTFIVTVSNKSEYEDLSKVVVTGNKFDVTKKVAFLPAGQSRTLEVSYTVKDSDYPKLENKVIVFALNEYGEELVCEEKHTISILKPEVKVLNKGPDTAEVGQVITYTIVVTNTGKVPLSNITVVDSKQDWSQKLESLAPGLSQTYEAKYTVTEDDYPTLESIVTVNARNIHGMDISANDMHNVFVYHKKDGPKDGKKTTPRKMEVLFNKEGEPGSDSHPEREERQPSIASLIPENMRGVSLLLNNEIAALSGLVQQGDRVDVFLVSSERESIQKSANHPVVENAIFLKDSKVPGEKRERAVILAVTPEQAEKLAAAYGRGSYHLVLRPPLEEKEKPTRQNKFMAG